MTQQSLCNNRILWIDLAKFLAIVAVLTIHTQNILYTNPNIVFLAYFSVSLFILVTGITTTWSFQKHSNGYLGIVRKKITNMLVSYTVATFIYYVFIFKSFDFESFLTYYIHFNVSGPFYYVLLYIQLIAISPILFFVLKKSSDSKLGILYEILTLFILLILSSLTTRYINILGVYGGGGKLFGGTFLTIFYLGMLFGKYCKKIKTPPTVAGTISIIFLVLTILWWRFITIDSLRLDSKLPFGDGYNPHSISFGLYAILILVTLFFFEISVQNHLTSLLMKPIIILANLGKHTLYIFLYHRFFLDVIFSDLLANRGVIINNIHIKRIVFFSGMFFGSILFEFILNKLKTFIKNCYA